MAKPKRRAEPPIVVAKALLHLAALTPLAILLWQMWDVARTGSNALGADPVAEIEHRLGLWALRFLMLTLAITVAVGMKLNYANIIALPLLLGIGVAFDIYFVMNWRAGQSCHLQSSTARAVLFSALTTMSAFGSLALSHDPGTAQMGMLLTLSLACTLFCTLIVLPALLGPAAAMRLQPEHYPEPSRAGSNIVIPGLVPGIPADLHRDGRDEPGHDDQVARGDQRSP